jgi:aspartokinase/homoserine dehydrogenase 1
LNYIFSSFDGTKKFSEVVAEAKEKGFTEPDPRDDLSGMDVARKILILSREAGLDMELSHIQVQNLVPEDCRDVKDVNTFMELFKNYDDQFQKLLLEAEADNKKLRYQATLDKGKVKVELNSVDVNHPFYSLSGSDNIILLTTERYHERPLVIRGPGAGAEVTAAGVFADVIRIGNYSS